MITIILSDDHTIVRQGLRVLLESEPDFRLVGEADDGLEAIRLVELLKPNILIVDLSMPNMNGLDVCRRIHKNVPDTKTIILSMHSNESYVQEALTNGASGYVLKKNDAMELLRAIREVTAGRRYLSPPLSDQAIEAYIKKKESTHGDAHKNITAREREILHLAAEGYIAKEIAERLTISPRTVEHHLANLMNRFNLHQTTDLIRYAKKQGLLPTDQDTLDNKN
jgi:two-component system, NarL family, response regulator NreC